MRNIIFNAMILDDKPTGLGVFTKNVIENIDKEYIKLIVSQKALNYGVENEIINIESNSKIKKIFFRNYKFNKKIKKIALEEDVVFSPTQHGLSKGKFKQVITIHDLIPLLYPEGRRQQYIYYKYILPNVIRKVDKIITVSNYTKRDLIKYYKIEPNKIEVVYNGYDKPKYIDKEYSKKYVYDKFKLEKYILMVGINYNYKNLHSVIEAYKNINTDLKIIIVGNYNVSYGSYLREMTLKYNLEKNVLFLGYVSSEDKERLYQAAEFFIFPSLYEGFGLPVLEAMANKIPVLLSNATSLPEVGGEAAIYFDPNSIKDIEQKIKYIISMSDEEREQIIIKGLYNIEKFSWEKCSSEILKVLNKI